MKSLLLAASCFSFLAGAVTAQEAVVGDEVSKAAGGVLTIYLGSQGDQQDQSKAKALSLAVPLTKDGTVVSVLHETATEGQVYLAGHSEHSWHAAKLLIRDPLTGMSLLKVGPCAACFSPSKELINFREQSGVLYRALRNPSAGDQSKKLHFAPCMILGEEISYNGERFPLRILQVNAGEHQLPTGSPILDQSNQVVALILSAIHSEVGAESGNYFALPIRIAHKLLADQELHGEVQKAWVGLSMDGSQSIPKIQELREGGPAQQAGLQQGDVIINFAQREVRRIEDVVDACYYMQVGVPSDITVLRGLEQKSFRLNPQPHPDPLKLGRASKSSISSKGEADSEPAAAEAAIK